jgi:hypothetical protein
MSIVKYSEINSEEERVNAEIESYVKILRKLREKSNEQELKESKIPSKPICLSSLRSPISNRNLELSKDELNEKLRHCADCLIKLGREVLP